MSLMGMIRVARAQLGMDEDAYRTLLLDTLGKSSLAGSTAKEKWRVMEELKSRGFQPRPFHKGKEAVIEILKQHLDRCDDPKKRAICLAILKDEDAPPVLDGRAVVGGIYGGVHQ